MCNTVQMHHLDSPFNMEAVISAAVESIECRMSPSPKYFIISIISSKIPLSDLAFFLSVIYLSEFLTGL